MKSVVLLATGFGLFLFDMAPVRAAETPPSKDALEFFEARVRPVLVANCISCHGETKQKSGLRLDSRAALLKGGRSGPAVTLGEPEKSALVRAIHYDAKPKMPPEGKLPDEAITALTDWVKLGAPWPQGAAEEIKLGASNVSEVRKSHWSFRPVVKPPLPTVKDSAWAATPIDRFILAKCESKRMSPARPADRRTLIRRATFDLIGLPPTPEEIAAFEADSSRAAVWPNCRNLTSTRGEGCVHLFALKTRVCAWLRRWTVFLFVDLKLRKCLRSRRKFELPE